MSNRILVFYGSYRSDRMGIRLAEFVLERFRRRGEAVELIDAKAVNLPMLDRMYKEYPPGGAPSSFSGWPAKFAMPMVSYSSPANIIGVSSPDSRTSRIIFWKNGSGGPLRSQAIRQGVCPAHGPQQLGTAHSPRWEWWWFQARLPLVPSDRPSRLMVHRWAKAAKPSKGRSRASPTI